MNKTNDLRIEFEGKVIIVKLPSESKYNELLHSAVKDALLSGPFLYNRMGYTESMENFLRRIDNYIKGLFGERVFEYFCVTNNLKAEFYDNKKFWKPDDKDFEMNGEKYDIKTNCIYHTDDLYKYPYILLPALIPNDTQWSTRKNFLFAFLKRGDNSSSEINNFFTLGLTEEQKNFVYGIYLKYKDNRPESEPYKKEWFLRKLRKCGRMSLISHFMPDLIITAYADESHYDKFKTLDVYSHAYQNYSNFRWYDRNLHTNNSTGKQKCIYNFLDGVFFAKISNKAAPICELSAFVDKFPQLKEVDSNGNPVMKCGVFRENADVFLNNIYSNEKLNNYE